ncbi:MAG: M48 family metalloprotease [Candidatus Omnitrophica bacterium]|nr:M48 family metalloprotease [Candidatus Omnitrophota bacterium]
MCILSGCATLYNSATGRSEVIWVNSQTEVSIGQSVQKELLKKHALVYDPLLKERVESVGRKLAAVSDRKDISYYFAVLADKELNALALPGGFIYIYQGLIKVLNDDELAYVLGHEVGHVAARHIAKKLQANMTYQLVLGLAFAGISSSTGLDTSAIAQGIDTVFNLIELGYSRQDEYEADRLAAKYAFKSGFNPNGSLSALEKIKNEEGPNWSVLGYFRSHPYADERINALKAYIPLVTGKNN